jgi:hypothetical protein
MFDLTVSSSSQNTEATLSESTEGSTSCTFFVISANCLQMSAAMYEQKIRKEGFTKCAGKYTSFTERD